MMDKQEMTRFLGGWVAGTAMVLVIGCGTAASKVAQTADTAATAANTQTAATNGTATSGGGVALTQPTTATAGTSKVRVLVTDPTKCAASAPAGQQQAMPPAGGDRQHHFHGGFGRQSFNGDKGGDKGGPKFGAPEDGCMVKNVVADYAAGQTLTVDGIAAGSYTVTVILENDVGAPLEQGSATAVVIADGKTAAAAITLAPVTQTGGSVAISITNPVAAKLMVTDSAIAGAVSACTPVHLEIQDSAGNPALASASVAVSLASSASTGAFYSDSNCSTAITAASIDMGYDAVEVFYKDSAAGTPTLTITETSSVGLSAATMAATVGP